MFLESKPTTSQQLSMSIILLMNNTLKHVLTLISKGTDMHKLAGRTNGIMINYLTIFAFIITQVNIHVSLLYLFGHHFENVKSNKGKQTNPTLDQGNSLLNK